MFVVGGTANTSKRGNKVRLLLVEDVLELPVVDLENLPEMEPVLVGFIITSQESGELESSEFLGRGSS